MGIRDQWGTMIELVLILALISAVPGTATAQNGHPSVADTPFARNSSWDTNYSQGRTLFIEHCGDCHGKQGKGKIGLPLNLQSFLVIADKGYIKRSMRFGRETRGMPSFTETLKPAQMEAIALFVKGWQYQPSLTLPAGHMTGDIKDGAELFRGLCTGCHGLKGEGGPEAGGGHVIGAVSGIGGPALADQGFLKSATDSYIKATLMYGRLGTPMGAYLKGRQGFVELHENEIDNIVSYLRSLEK
jgi:cytochrome c oxidase cbb3-type subunit 3